MRTNERTNERGTELIISRDIATASYFASYLTLLHCISVRKLTLEIVGIYDWSPVCREVYGKKTSQLLPNPSWIY